MKNIIVAGAGIGGLVAGARLAQQGYNVRMIAACTPETHGHDWDDSFSYTNLEETIGKPVDPKHKNHDLPTAFFGPAKDARLQPEFTPGDTFGKMERRTLSSLLIEYARESGVQFVWNTKIISAITKSGRVVGVRTADRTDYMGDLVIDACGASSAVRRSLPVECNIENNFAPGEVFYAYRAFYEKNDPENKCDLLSEVYLMHQGDQGISWLGTRDNFVDILIGRIFPIDSTYVERAVADLRKDRPQLGKKLLRGGQIVPIPVRRPIIKSVCDGYAAIGDSAYMTIPMIGSGIDLSMHAGILLANTVMTDTEGLYTTETLWPYHRDYIRHHAASLVGMDRLKNTLLNYNPSKIDVLFRKRIVTENDLASAGGSFSAAEVLGRVQRGFFHLPTLLTLAKAALGGGEAEAVYKQIPDEYTPAAFEKWKKAVEATVIPIQLR